MFLRYRFAFVIVVLFVLASCSAPASPAPTSPPPTTAPTVEPTVVPTQVPTIAPTAVPLTVAPTIAPTPTVVTEVVSPTNTTTATNTFDLAVAQMFLDSAGLHGMAEKLTETKEIDSASLPTVRRLSKILKVTSFPSELQTQAQDFVKQLDTFALAMQDDKVDEAVAAAEPVHEAQHELSHAIDEWIANAPAAQTTPNRFDIVVAQTFLDTAGLHGMAESLNKTKTIESSYAATVNRLLKVLKQTTFPTEVDAQAQAFIKQLDAFATALQDDKVDDAVAAAEPVHEAQHELSHAIDEWGASAPAAAGQPNAFQLVVAQTFLDTAGLHDMAAKLNETKTIESSYAPTVTRLLKVLKQTTFPAAMEAQAQDFITQLSAFATALQDDKVDDAVAAAEPIHEAQHALSHAIDDQVGGLTAVPE